MNPIVFTTNRLRVRIAETRDADFYFTLWKEPRVMRNIGLPEGLPITREEIVARLERGGDSEFERLLVVERESDGEIIGECYLHSADGEGVAGTDVKLLPEHWGLRYGVEVKQGLVDYLFTETDCVAVQATPNLGNVASIRMQEAVGGVCVGEEDQHLVYRVFRETWSSTTGSK